MNAARALDAASTRWPSLFLIGAPKCGTTSLAAWLGAHPAIFMSDPKEPNHYAPDIASSRPAATRAAYAALFHAAEPGQVLAEASTTYLRSAEAVPALLQDVPEARLVVCLRNPVEMAPSVHGQLVRTGREPIRDFASAWAAQAARRAAPDKRRVGHNPDDLQYGTMCRLGAQVERLLQAVPRAQVHFVFAEDMRADPGAVYRQVLGFAGVADDGRTDFPSLNARAAPRSAAVARLAHAGAALKERLGIRASLRLGRLVARANETAPAPGAGPDPALRRELAAYFRADVALLSRLTGRDLSHWTAAA